MTTPSPLLRALLLALLTAFPALAQSVTGTVTAATQLIVSAGFPPANTNTRPAGTNLTGGLNLGTSWTVTPLFVSVNSAFGFSATASSVTHTISESMSGFNAPVSAGPHATLLTLTASQPVTGTLTVQYTPGASGGGASSTASIDIGNNGSVEWAYAPGSLTFQVQVTVNGSLPIRAATAMVSTSHSLSVQFANWTPVPRMPLVSGGFESGLAGWAVSGPASVFGTALGHAPRSGGSQCVMAGWSNVSQTFAAASGETYALHCYAARDAQYFPGDSASARFEFLDALGAGIGGASATLVDIGTPNFTWISSPTLVQSAPPGTVAVKVTLQYYQYVPTGLTFFDDVHFERVEGCGAFSLPVGSISGSPGKSGEYFTVDVRAPNGIRVCGLDMALVAASAGTNVHATVYRHRSLTGATQLTLAQTTADNWCPIATVQGVAAATGQLTPMSVVNATNSVDLAPGQTLLAIVLNSQSPGSFQFTPATGFTVVDAGNDLRWIAASSLNTGFDPGVPLPPIPGYVPAKVRYELLSAPTPPTTCAAEAVPGGGSCGGEPNTVFEMLSNTTWDLSSSDVVVAGNGTGASLSTVPATPFDPVVGPAIPLSGGIGGPIPLGFSLDAFGMPNESFLMVSTSGQIFFGGQSNRRNYPTPGVWSNDPVRRLAACSTDFLPGSIHVDAVSGIRTIVTFVNMWEPAYNQYATFQIVVAPTTMRIRYDPASWFTGVVGFHNGIPLPAPPHVGQVDLTAGPSPFTSPNPTPDVTLTVLSRPLLGANFDFRLDNCQPVGLVFLDFAHTGPGVPLPTPQFAAGCNLYIGLNPAMSFAMAPGSVSSSFTPNDTTFLGYEFALQGGGLLPNGRIAASNAYNGIVGNW